MVVSERDRELLRIRQEAARAVMLLYGVMNDLGTTSAPDTQMTAAGAIEAGTMLVQQLTAIVHPDAPQQEWNAMMLAALSGTHPRVTAFLIDGDGV